MLKKILFALMFAIVATVTHADPIGISEGGGTPDPGVQYGITDPEEDEVVEEEDNGMKIAASKAYVDTMVETRQDKIPAANQQGVGAGETVMTYTAAGNGAIGERGIYTGANAYNANSDADKLITASALNDTFTNLPTTGTTKLQCANLNDGCTLWTIVDQTAYTFQLPNGYTQLEYIESTGTQYIDTGLIGTSITGFEVKGTVAVRGSSNTQLLGGTQDAANTFFGARIVSSNIKWYCMDDSNGIGLGTPTHLSVITATIESTTSQPGTLYDTVTGTTVPFAKFNSTTWGFPAENLLLFGGHANRKSPNATCYYLKLYTQDGLAFYGIPAKNINNVVGMYDLVSGQFFTNRGTGDFTPGPAVN